MLGAVLFAIATAIVTATDEAYSTLGHRISRLCALAPVVAALAIAIVVSQSKARGEVRALMALGLTPERTVRGATIAGLALGAVAIGLLASPWADPRSLFPAVTVDAAWVLENGALVEAGAGVRVQADGMLVLLEPRGSGPAGFLPSRAAAIAAIAPVALLTPPWVTTPMPLGLRGLTFALTVVFLVVALHVVAAGRWPPWALPFATTPLLFGLAWRKLGVRT